MAECEEWVVGEDGCLSVGEVTDGITYHPTLNTILVTTKEPAVKVLDVNSGTLLQKSTLSATPNFKVNCIYLPNHDKVFFTDGHSVGLRRDHNGVLLLDTILQTPVSRGDDIVRIELPLTEAWQLYQCLINIDLQGLVLADELIKILEEEVCVGQIGTKGSSKATKWYTVCLTLPHNTLKTFCSSLVQELKKLNRYIPALAIASAISERLNLLLPNNPSDGGSTSTATVDRSLMYSESARRETFGKWPHMNYKWALPDQMAQAGFYHQPNSTGDDRAMCFTCSVCLVCWEPTDEPWSEHERHSPSCPFVKGEYTQNVPLSVTYATNPAILHGDKQEEIHCVSPASNCDLMATSTKNGCIVVWNVSKQLKKEVQFCIDPGDPLLISKDLHPVHKKVGLPKQAWMEEKSEIEIETTQTSTNSHEEGPETPVFDAIVEIPLDDLSLDELLTSTRPTDDIEISSICIASPIKSFQDGGTVITESLNSNKPSLISGVRLLRRDTSSPRAAVNSTSRGINSDDSPLVQALNDVNEASSREMPLDIMRVQENSSSTATFVPCILVYDFHLQTLGPYLETKPSAVTTNVKKLSSATSSGTQQECNSLYGDFGDLLSEICDDTLDPICGLKFVDTGPFSSISNSSGIKFGGPSGSSSDYPNTETNVTPSTATQVDIQLSRMDLREKFRSGCLTQCVELPFNLQKENFIISFLTPTVDEKYLLVTVNCRTDSMKDESAILTARQDIKTNSANSFNNDLSLSFSKNNEETKFINTNTDKISEKCTGAFLLYKLNFTTEAVTLEEKPTKIFLFEKVAECVRTVLMLPLEATDFQEEQLNALTNSSNPVGHFVSVTYEGSIRLHELTSLKVVAEFSSSEEFISVTYCSSIERVCACSANGNLHFLHLWPCRKLIQENESNIEESTSNGRTVHSYKDGNISGQASAGKEQEVQADDGIDLLVKQPLTQEVLTFLHELVQFESLIPRFSATVPSCWTEIQQEQKQRRHPQHLQQQGEAMQHTRSWRLQHDCNTWDEHLFEITLPKSCCIGHIDFKFNLHPVCTTPPNIQITLLKQNTGGIGRLEKDIPNSDNEVDAGIDFNTFAQSESDPTKENPLSSQGTDNPVLTPEFLIAHNAELLCGPLDISSYVDLSGQSGIVTLTSPELFGVKTRTFLIHLKAFINKKDLVNKSDGLCNRRCSKLPTVKPKLPVLTNSKAQTNKASLRQQYLVKVKDKLGGVPSLQSLLEYYAPPGSAVERLAATAPNKKIDNLKGCDWFHEISITIRRTKRTNIPHERIQRCAMLDSQYLQEKLIQVICGEDKLNQTISIEQRQHLALDILIWIAAIQMNKKSLSDDNLCLFNIQANLSPLIKSCFIDGTRSIAHKCAKLIIICLEHSKIMKDQDVSPVFNYLLLQGLLEWLPSFPQCQSAGALRWLCLLLNRVKCLNVATVGQKCMELLVALSKQLNERTSPLHSLLRARFGLYGTPFEPELYDIEPPPPLKPSSTPLTYACVVASSNNANNNASQNQNTAVSTEELDLRGLLNIGNCDNLFLNRYLFTFPGQHLKGLLEVEPLHFTCHAASDGTKMEKIELGPGSGSSGTGTLPLSSNVFEQLPQYLPPPSGFTSWTGSLSSLFSTLKKKQEEFLKLQQQHKKLEQKLAETVFPNQANLIPFSTKKSKISSLAVQSNPYPGTIMVPSTSIPGSSAFTFHIPTSIKSSPHIIAGSTMNSDESTYIGLGENEEKAHVKFASKTTKETKKDTSSLPTTMMLSPWQQLLQPPPQQALVIERMHSGARRFVVLDFGKQILLTDLMIPSCSDLVSLSIDIWTQAEEIDGQRLVVTTDIGIRSLVMSDLQPPPVCRFLKITTIGRYGMNSTRCRIPIGTFYGHTFILPWELISGTPISSSKVDDVSEGKPFTFDMVENQIQSQLNILSSLLEDIHCRYSLACDKLFNLLSPLLPTEQNNANHTNIYLQREKDKLSEEDQHIVSAYQDCLQLQQQLNLVTNTISRLERAQGSELASVKQTTSPSTSSFLKTVCTDKLRVLSECLLDVLLGLTYPTPSIPQLPASLYMAFDQKNCETLFRFLCVNGTRRMQLNASTLLVRMCGLQPWWGSFVARMLVNLYNSEQTLTFPQDRVFILLTYLGQKSLTCSATPTVLESVINLLEQLLTPLIDRNINFVRGILDIPLIGWVLLFLSVCLDNIGNGNQSSNDDGDMKSCPKDKDAGSVSNRWDFIQGEVAMLKNKASTMKSSSVSVSSRLYRRKLQKRLMHHKQQNYIFQLEDLEQAKKAFLASTQAMSALHSHLSSKGGSTSTYKELEAAVKQQEQIFKMALKQHSAKHFKDILQIRRTDGPLLTKTNSVAPNNAANGAEKEDSDNDISFFLPLSRNQTLPVAKGLVSLLLAMDFTCNVDMFLLACKVLGRISVSTRPAICLGEIFTQEQLSHLVQLCVGVESHANSTAWGGPWASHAITCLLQDILEGERLFPSFTSHEGSPTEEELPNLASGTDDSLQQASSSQLPADVVDAVPADNIPDLPGVVDSEDSESDECNWEIFDEPHPAKKLTPGSNKKSWTGIFSAIKGQKEGRSQDASNSSLYTSANTVSTAVDARLEFGVEMSAEMRLKILTTLEADGLSNAICAPLQVPPEGAIQEVSEETYESETHDISDLNGVPFDVTSSLDMLGQCFDQIFSQLQVLQINLEALLQLWLTLIEEVNTDTSGGPSGFDPGIIPVIPLSPTAVSGLLAALTWYPTISLRTWCLAFQTLTLVSNLKLSANDCSSPDGSGPSNWRAQSIESSQEPLDLSQNWMGVVIVNDANLLPVLMKFLSGTGLEHGLSAIRNSVGPSVTQALHDFIIRLQLRCDVITPGSKLGCHLKELLLKLIHLLISNSGAIQNFHGPLDAQCKFIDLLQNLRFDNLDITIAMNVITETVTLVHNYIVSTERVICRSSIETGVNPSSCFGGLFAPVLRGDGKSNSVTGNRDMLVCSLLKLVNRLIQAPLLEPRITSTVRTPLTGSSEAESLDKTGMSPELLTDSTKIEQQAGSCSSNIIVTEAQTDEHKTAAASNSHGTAVRCNHSIASNSVRTVYVADSVLQHQPTMLRLLSALASCTGSTMAMLLGSSGINSTTSADSSDRFVLGEPVSVGDSVFHLLCTMNRKASCINLILQPIFNYMSSNPFEELPSSGLIVVPRLSEPLLWFILKVLDCESALSEFLNMGGIQVICQNLVHSNHQLINSHPSFVSAVMQYLSNSRSVGQNTKHQGTDLETVDGLINFAPLGAISSSNPTAQPADVLIQAAPPHRRARTPAWSYHFYPEESWIDLTVTLPCAVLLKEIHIQPHLTSLATCPSAVSVEVSRDGYTGSTPLCPPQPTNGLTFIRLQLTRPEIITSVTLRLHKPRDSSNIGLSQVLLLGSTTFGEAVAKSRTATMPSEDNVTRSSLGWLRILHHCLTLPVSISVRQLICKATVSVPYLLQACCTLLLTPALGIYMTHIEHVLLQLGLHSTDVGLKEIDILLRSSGWAHTQDASQSLFHNSAVDSVVEIVYQLCITQDEGTKSRVEAVLKWLVNAAQKAIQQHLESGHKPWQSFPLFGSSRTSPAITFVQCVAAILWHLHETLNDLDLTSLVSENMFRLLYDWSMTLSARSALKRAVDLVLCSLCYICPEYFNKLLLWMGILVPSSSVISSSDAAISDDRKNPISLTDDSKEAGADNELVLQNISGINIEETHLMTLATVSQSPVAIRQLLDSGFLSLLAQSILDFCKKEALGSNANQPTDIETKIFKEELISGQSTNDIYSGIPSTSKSEYIEPEFHLNPAELEHVSKPVWYTSVNPNNHEGMTDAAKAGNSKYCQKTFSKPEFLVSAEFVAAALNFFKEICSEGVIRDWLGGPEGNIFWLPLLLMLCDPNLRSSTSHYEVKDNSKATTLNSQQRSAIEVSTLHLLTHCCWAHPTNQQLLSQVLCEVIRQQGSTQQDGSMGFIHAISGFTRRLILQLLLENEKIQVFVKSMQPLPKCSIGLSSNQPQHPRFGCGHHFRLLYISTQTTCADIIKNVTDVSGLIHTPPVPEHKDEKEPIKKDITEIGLELVDHLSVAAGVTAKDKRQRDVKPPVPERRDHNGSETVNPPANSVSLPTSILTHELIPNQVLPPSLTLAQLLTLLEERGHSLSSTSLTLTVTQIRKSRDSRDGVDGSNVIPESVLLGCTPLPTTLQVFASIGGLALLAQHLPLLYPEITRYSSPVYRTATADKSGTDLNTGLDSEWVKVEATEDIYDDFPEFIPPGASSPQSSRSNPVPPPSIPPHSLAAFGLFLRLPGYAEVLLKERKKAQCLLRLALGITDNGEGGDIFQSPMASSLPTLPFQILQQLFDSTPLTTDDGVLLRRMTLEVGAIHLLLACLAALSHQSCDINLPGFQNELIMAAAKAVSNAQDSTDKTDDKSHLYWAKGTGFGTGSTNQSWDVEQAIMRQRSEEEHVTCLLQVLSSYINPGGHIPSHFNSKDNSTNSTEEDISPPVLLPSVFYDLLYQSCLLPAISSYLRNDSVLDMARHVPLYRALLQLLRAVAVSSQLVGLLLPIDLQDSSLSVCSLLAKMKNCVDTYASRLKLNKNKGNGKAKGKSVAKLKEEDEENEGLAQLIPDIQKTAKIVHLATKRMLLEEDTSSEDLGDKYSDSSLTVIQPSVKSLEERYIEVMKKLQFDTYEMIVEEDDTIRFIVSHHFESNMRASWDTGHPARARRLAQETVTLSTSLPLSFSSSVFVRCDQDRLDIMKVLITGPSDTPYANGCFEFDVYFPPDYPNSPMLINLETTGHHTVRFNPNLYNDGKVCLSVLNTWHGRPEEKWNPQTSSFLQVLVSIQSLILVSEPYFNEPGYERSRGSPSGNQSSREYDSNIRQANVKWAMLEQIRNPCPCFKEVIHKHFWMKRAEIVQQIDSWIVEMDAQGSDRRTGRTIALNCVALKRHFSQLKEEFMKMKAPEGLEDLNDLLDLSNNHMASDAAAVTSAESSSRESPDSANVSIGPI